VSEKKMSDDRIRYEGKPGWLGFLIMLPRLLKTAFSILVLGLGKSGCKGAEPPPETNANEATVPPAVEVLIRELRTGDLATKRHAIARCTELGPEAARAAEALKEAYFLWDVEDDDLYEEVQEEVTNALIAIGPACAPVVIIDLGADEMEGYGERILAGMGESVIPALITAIEDDDTLCQIRIFWRVADLLGRFGKLAEPAIPALQKAAQYDDPDYPKIAEETISKIRGTAAK
jgi:hypothetical protein